VEYGSLYFPDYPLPEYNLQKAKQLLAESSYKGEPITYIVGSYTFSGEAAEAIVDMWKQIGVNAQVINKRVDETAMVSAWSNSMRFADPAGGLWLLWGPPSNGRTLGKEGSWKDIPDEFVKAGQELLVTTDRNRRAEIARKLMELWDYYAPASMLYQPIDAFGVSDKINWTPTNFHAINLRAGNISLK
jgi:peptide/nickel transport system substrate-binding protein